MGGGRLSRPFTCAFKQNKDVCIDPEMGRCSLSRLQACEGFLLLSKDVSGPKAALLRPCRGREAARVCRSDSPPRPRTHAPADLLRLEVKQVRPSESAAPECAGGARPPTYLRGCSLLAVPPVVLRLHLSPSPEEPDPGAWSGLPGGWFLTRNPKCLNQIN